MRCFIEHISNGTAHCTSATGEAVRFVFASTPFAHLQEQLCCGDEVSLLGGYEHRGVLHPELVVLEPRFLIDVTTLCSCCKSYGFNARNALLNKFDTRVNSKHIQLGNLAGDFFDECVHAPVQSEERKEQYLRVVQRSFRDNALSYTALDGIDRDFFLRADQLHKHICDTVPQLPQGLILEPTFVCHDLGLQGRMDALSSDHHTIVELKSGKYDEWRRNSKAKQEHELQMMLYSEMLHYCTGMPRGDIRLLLFYCQYPVIQQVRYSKLQMQQAMAVRNALVHQEQLLRDGKGALFMAQLTEDDFVNVNGLSDNKFYHNYCRPIIIRFLERMNGMDALTASYFHTFTAFVEREQWLAKTVAYQGARICGLHLEPIRDEAGAIASFDARTATPAYDSEADLRIGDMVVLFQDERHQYFSAYITHIDDCLIHLVLTHKQRDEQVFDFEAEYCITAGYMEAGFGTQYRGLAALAQANEERRMALLTGTADYQLIVGPPGTGKTSRTLRDITTQHIEGGGTLLLMAYTNQAVDEICTMLTSVYPEYMRIGKREVCAAQHRHRLLSEVIGLASNRQAVKELIGQTRVIVGTVSAITACHELFMLQHFDLTVIDEASQVLEPQIVPLLCRVDRFILIGDHKQLPAVVIQPHEQCEVNDPELLRIGLCNLSDSYFERLLRIDAQNGGHRTTMLWRQGRMHEDIMAFANHHFYGDRLRTAALPHQHETSDEPRCIFVNVPYNGQQALKANAAEAQAVVMAVQHIMELYQPFDPTLTLGIIVPFRAQIMAIRNALLAAGIAHATAITIDTVERYQGSQRDVIIYSTTVTQPEQLDFISVVAETEDGPVDRKLNVALTRARKQMIMIGCRRVLIRSSLYADWISNASQKKRPTDCITE